MHLFSTFEESPSVPESGTHIQQFIQQGRSSPKQTLQIKIVTPPTLTKHQTRTNRPNQGKFESWVYGRSATDHPCALQRQACFWLALWLPPRTAGGFFYPHLNFPGSSCYTFSEPIPQWLFFYFLAFSWLVSGHPTSRLKDGVKVSTSACCGGWSQSLNIRFHFSL